MNFNVVDIAIMAIVFIFAIAGFARGFLASLIKMFGSIASLAIAVWLAKPVAVFVDGFANLTTFFSEKIGEVLAGVDTLFTAVVGTDLVLPGGVVTGADIKIAIDNIAGISGVFKTAMKWLIEDSVILENGTVVGEWFAGILAGIAVLIVSALAIFIAIRIAVGILSKIFDAITKNAAIGGLDRLLGLALGAAKGGALIVIFFAVLSVIMPVFGVDSLILPYIENSVIGSPVFNYVFAFVEDYISTIDFNSIIQGLFANISIGL